jgi:peptide deformylase
MPIMPVYNCFNPVLRQKTKKIENIDDKLIEIINDMFETMYNADGIGLAANQVGLDISLFVMDSAAKSDDDSNYSPIVLINPEIISSSEEKSFYQEGCLSIPKVYEDVERPKEIEVKYYDQNMKEVITTLNALQARIFQHELDHLNGVLFFDRITPLKKALLRNKLKMVERNRIETRYDMIDAKGNLIKGVEEED